MMSRAALLVQNCSPNPQVQFFRVLDMPFDEARELAAITTRRVRNVAATLGLSEFPKRKPHALSGG